MSLSKREVNQRCLPSFLPTPLFSLPLLVVPCFREDRLIEKMIMREVWSRNDE